MADVDMDPIDPDPIVSSYDVFIKPQISDSRQIYVLQFPNRDPKQPFTQATQSKPLKLRIKPEAGMLEMDVPLDAMQNYDRSKGIKWGEAMKKSDMTKGSGSHGMPGGFGIGGAQPTGRGKGRGEAEEEINQERLLADYEGAIERGQVLTKQTLGGQTVPNEETTPQYMIGTFLNNQLHLTPADHIVQMRAQFHHIDAHAELERQGRPRDPALAARVTEARAVHMTVRNPVDGEEESTDTMAERISATQAEAWRKHSYVDENAQEAWQWYEDLFVGGASQHNPDLVNIVPALKSALEDSEFLDAISAPRDAARLSRSKRGKKDKEKDKGKGKEKAVDGDGDESASTLSDPPTDSDDEDDDIA